jgi:hypothetical protein
MSNAGILGHYSPFSSKIDEQAQQAFKEALTIVGVKYSPVAVSQQLVAGLNYRFFCNTETVTHLPYIGAAIVSIYKPLDGPAHLTGIKNID